VKVIEIILRKTHYYLF